LQSWKDTVKLYQESGRRRGVKSGVRILSTDLGNPADFIFYLFFFRGGGVDFEVYYHII
jgi:hypothetical protein